MNWLFALVASFFMFWSIILVIASFEIDNPKIFWTQRILAFIFILGSLGAVYVHAFS